MEGMSDLDEKLVSRSQQSMSRLVKALPDEAPSMVWRSGLNEALLAQSAKVSRKRLLWRFARPTLGLGVACALAAAVIVFPMSHRSQMELPATVPVQSQTGDLAAGLFQIHHEDVRAVDLTGAGLNPVEASAAQTTSSVSQDDVSESDLEL